jgi:hypothetical protein
MALKYTQIGIVSHSLLIYLLKKVRAQYFSSNFGSSVSLPPPYDCRQLQAIVTLEKKPQYFLCESLLCNGSYQLQGPFDSNDEVIAAFLRVFTELTGQTWDQRDTYINERSDYYCYIDYEPLENHEQKEKKVVARKTWKFVDFKNSFVPICKEVDKDVYEVFDRYIKDNCIKSEMLRNPIITGVSLSFHAYRTRRRCLSYHFGIIDETIQINS